MAIVHLTLWVRVLLINTFIFLNELCNGRPSEETVQFLRSLERPLDAPSEEITRLFGANFDTRVINQDML
jgi:hypothetical protein